MDDKVIRQRKAEHIKKILTTNRGRPRIRLRWFDPKRSYKFRYIHLRHMGVYRNAYIGRMMPGVHVQLCMASRGGFWAEILWKKEHLRIAYANGPDPEMAIQLAWEKYSAIMDDHLNAYDMFNFGEGIPG